MNKLRGWKRIEGTQFLRPPTGKITCQICHMGDFAGYVDIENGRQYPSDLDSNIHKGFTIGRGKTIYWMVIWHSSGNATAFNEDATYGRWIAGDTEITIHWLES